MTDVDRWLEEDAPVHIWRQADAFRAYVRYVGEDYLDNAIETFEDAYAGRYESEEDFAWELADSTGMIPPSLNARYFDAQAFAHDLFMGDYYMDEDGYVFRNV